MAPDADATAGASQGWHDLEAVLAEEPAAKLLAAYLGVEAQHRRAAVADLGVRRIGQDLGSVGLKGHRRTGRPRPDARSPDDLLRVHNSVEPLSQMRIALGAGVRGGTPALLVAQCRICAVLQQ